MDEGDGREGVERVVRKDGGAGERDGGLREEEDDVERVVDDGTAGGD